jgi:hypothetical protein
MKKIVGTSIGILLVMILFSGCQQTDSTGLCQAILTSDTYSNYFVNATFTSTDRSQAKILSKLGTMIPTDGDTFVLLSTGRAGATLVTTDANNPGSERGTAFGNIVNDYVQLTIILKPPANTVYLYFDYQFFTTEWPEKDEEHRDAFTVIIKSRSIGTSTTVIDVDSGDLILDAGDLSGTGFDIFASNGNPAGRETTVSTAPYTGTGSYDSGADAGATPLTTFSYRFDDFSHGETITLSLIVRDMGDSYLDSAVFLDNLRFSGPNLP